MATELSLVSENSSPGGGAITSARTPPQPSLLPARSTSTFEPSSRTPRKKELRQGCFGVARDVDHSDLEGIEDVQEPADVVGVGVAHNECLPSVASWRISIQHHKMKG